MNTDTHEQITGYRSIARWPRGFVNLMDPNNESDDTHATEEQARAVCEMLESRGFGGDGRIFPISTRVEPIRVTPAVPAPEPNHPGCDNPITVTTHPSPISGKPGRKLVNCGCGFLLSDEPYPAPEPEIAELRKQAAPLLYAEQTAQEPIEGDGQEARNREESLAAKRKYVEKCHHLPELVIDSENGPICCECWAIEEKARADRWQSMLEANNHLMPTGNNFPFCVETFFRQVEKMKESSKETGERADFHMERSVLAMHIAEEPDWMEVVADCPMLAAVKALRARVEQLALTHAAEVKGESHE